MQTTITSQWLDFLKDKYGEEAIKKTSVHIIRKEPTDKKGITEIPLDKLYEFYGNLILNGFSEAEALTITSKVASHVRAS